MDSAARWAAEHRNTEDLEDRIARHHVVVGVFPQDGGYSWLKIKGDAVARSVIETGQSIDVSFAGVPCKCIEEAGAMRQVFGDGKNPPRMH